MCVRLSACKKLLSNYIRRISHKYTNKCKSILVKQSKKIVSTSNAPLLNICSAILHATFACHLPQICLPHNNRHFSFFNRLQLVNAIYGIT